MRTKAQWMRRCAHAAELRRQERERHRIEIRVLKSLAKPFVEGRAAGLRPALPLIDAKRYGEAREFVADFLERNPEHARGHALLIRIHGMLGEVGLSEHLFDHARRSGMECGELYVAMAGAYANGGEFRKALEVMAEAAEKGIDGARGRVNLMRGLYKCKMYAEMERFYFSIPQKCRERPAIIAMYADALRKMKRYGEAIRVAGLSLGMHGTLGDKTMAKLIIGYSEMSCGNHARAYEVLDEVYGKISAREDGGANFGFFPRLLCGMVFACSRGRIAQTASTIAQWHGLLEDMRRENRGKAKDVKDALDLVWRIPVACAQQAL
ncbi:MAG: hypothetical protein AB1657_00425 [Candidatus Micrarchaeota archaeon]